MPNCGSRGNSDGGKRLVHVGLGVRGTERRCNLTQRYADEAGFNPAAGDAVAGAVFKQILAGEPPNLLDLEERWAHVNFDRAENH